MKFYELVSTMRKDGYSERDIVDELGFGAISTMESKNWKRSIRLKLGGFNYERNSDGLLCGKCGRRHFHDSHACLGNGSDQQGV